MSRFPRLLLIILALYLAIASLYALLTPLWQAPDEPAHFNNVVFIAERGQLPVLQAGDYDQAYLEKLKAAHFPPQLSVASVRYEAHQPPLYYLLMLPVYWLVQGMGLAVQVWALRLFNVLLGAGVIMLIWLTMRRLFPARPRLALLAAGFVAFLPMHMAMSASINNDTLAELLIAGVMLRLLAALDDKLPTPGWWAMTGLLIGLGLLTKFQAYILVPLAGVVWLWQLFRTRQRRRLAQAWWAGVALAGPALLLALPWWLRNMRRYGFSDPLGLNRHNSVVVGQPRTVDWLAAQGWGAYLHRFFSFTFRSFWGVFGWMGVFMDARAYAFLTLLTLLIVVGLLYQLARWRQWRDVLSGAQWRGLGLLGLQLLIVLGTYVWYNLDFVQHQGRYLFPALLPMSLLVAVGLLGLFSPAGSRWGVVGALLLGGVWLVAGLMADNGIDKWGLLWAALAAALLGVRTLWPRASAFAWAFATEGLLALLALYALFGAILPQLR